MSVAPGQLFVTWQHVGVANNKMADQDDGALSASAEKKGKKKTKIERYGLENGSKTDHIKEHIKI